MLSVLRFIGILLALTRVVTVQPALATDVLSDPVATHHLQWSANKQHDFRYRFLKKIKVKTLKHATPATGMFNHHPYLAKIENNLYACWDTQVRDENTSGQHGVFCFSRNQGRTWTVPRTLFPPLAPNIPASETIEPGAFQTSQGFCEIDNELFAISIVDIDSKEKFFRFNEVSRTRVGLLARKVFVDGSLGDIFWVSGGLHTRTHDLPTFAKGPKKLIEKIDTHLSQPANLLQLIFGPKIHPDSDDNHRMTEPSPPWQLDDGTWVRLFRDAGSAIATSRADVEATKSRRNYVTFSADNGTHWSVPIRTDFPDACARSNSGRLPNGIFYVINNVLPMSPKNGGRSMLAISLSDDGLNFDRCAVIRFISPRLRQKGKAKGHGYAYPHSVVMGDDLWLIYSVNKEDIEVCQLSIEEIESL